MTRILLVAVLVVGCDRFDMTKQPCRESEVNGSSSWTHSECVSPQARIELIDGRVICRCPPFAQPAGSAKR